MKLVLPTIKYKNSFLKNLKELYLLEYITTGMEQKEIKKNFSKFLKIINGRARGKNLPKGRVPSSTYWLVDGKKYLGSVNIRHGLNAKLRKASGHIGYEIASKQRGKGLGTLILKLALKKAKQLGIKNALLVCDINSIASKKIIEKNGGKFEGSKNLGRGLPKILRYWIKT